MSIEENKVVFKRIVEEVFNNRDFSVIPELISPDFAFDAFFGEFRGPDGFRKMCELQNAAFPDLHYTVEDMIGEGEKLATQMTWSGTFEGEFGGVAPTGKHMSLTEAVFSTFKDGKETGPITYMDMLSFFQQAGITPPAG